MNCDKQAIHNNRCFANENSALFAFKSELDSTLSVILKRSVSFEIRKNLICSAPHIAVVEGSISEKSRYKEAFIMSFLKKVSF